MGRITLILLLLVPGIDADASETGERREPPHALRSQSGLSGVFTSPTRQHVDEQHNPDTNEPRHPLMRQTGQSGLFDQQTLEQVRAQHANPDTGEQEREQLARIMAFQRNRPSSRLEPRGAGAPRLQHSASFSDADLPPGVQRVPSSEIHLETDAGARTDLQIEALRDEASAYYAHSRLHVPNVPVNFIQDSAGNITGFRIMTSSENLPPENELKIVTFDVKQDPTYGGDGQLLQVQGDGPYADALRTVISGQILMPHLERPHTVRAKSKSRFKKYSSTRMTSIQEKWHITRDAGIQFLHTNRARIRIDVLTAAGDRNHPMLGYLEAESSDKSQKLSWWLIPAKISTIDQAQIREYEAMIAAAMEEESITPRPRRRTIP